MISWLPYKISCCILCSPKKDSGKRWLIEKWEKLHCLETHRAYQNHSGPCSWTHCCFPSMYVSPMGNGYIFWLSRKPHLGKGSQQICFTPTCCMWKSTSLSPLLLLSSKNKGPVPPDWHPLSLDEQAGDDSGPFLTPEISFGWCSLKAMCIGCFPLGVRDLSFKTYCLPSCPPSVWKIHILLISFDTVLVDTLLFWFSIGWKNWSGIDDTSHGGRWIISFTGIKNPLSSPPRVIGSDFFFSEVQFCPREVILSMATSNGKIRKLGPTLCAFQGCMLQ